MQPTSHHIHFDRIAFPSELNHIQARVIHGFFRVFEWYIPGYSGKNKN